MEMKLEASLIIKLTTPEVKDLFNFLDDSNIRIEITGSEGSKRFLVNSGHYEYWEGTNEFSQIRSFFWSAKKLEGTTIVKDFTEPIYSTCFSRKFSEEGERYSFYLSFSNSGGNHDRECMGGTATMMYEADIGSILEAGNPTATSG